MTAMVAAFDMAASPRSGRRRLSTSRISRSSQRWSPVDLSRTCRSADIASGHVEFAVLGPLEVRQGGDVLAVRRGRSRVLLISLLLRSGQVVPVDVLLEQVWGDRLPVDAVNALQVQVSYLRRALRPLRGDDEFELRT